ncbi:MAG TPA: prepilin-type N-terminal cleavage/methylation domain-containing protein [Patescibacteria group bacterium]|jgi:prepilin-type N-terminal cleavage/methylation domain-containing protein|nr:prepilin-type N-terminal cleavage/methylation domain-containing protein [Patescibacteria group bacterium]
MSKTSNLSKRGFTLVELLIVIVVIAILAAISIVAYNGVQNRGKAAAAQSLASQVAKKAEAWNTVEGTYPSYPEFTQNDGSNDPGKPDAAKLDDAGKVSQAVPTASTQDTVQYKVCNDTVNDVGFVVTYYDAVIGNTKAINGGTATGTTVNGAVTCA